MLNSPSPNPELLKTVLQPLLEDFEDWFGRSQILLETEKIPFLTSQEQTELLERVKVAQKEVQAARTLFEATQNQVGVDTRILLPWHHLVTECWQVTIRLRQSQSESNPS